MVFKFADEDPSLVLHRVDFTDVCSMAMRKTLQPRPSFPEKKVRANRLEM